MCYLQYVPPPETTVATATPLKIKEERYLPLGAAYDAFREVDSIQPRARYSRYLLPDPQTSSMQTLQNPKHSKKLIPCLRDQRRVTTYARQYMDDDPDYVEQRDAYEQIAMHSKHRLEKACQIKTNYSEAEECQTVIVKEQCPTDGSYQKAAEVLPKTTPTNLAALPPGSSGNGEL